MDQGNCLHSAIRRFLSNKRISPTLTIVPLIYLMHPFLENIPTIVSSVDHTDRGKRRKCINILSFAFYYKSRALPFFDRSLT